MNVDQIVLELEACVEEAKREVGLNDDNFLNAELVVLYLPVLQRKIKERSIVQAVQGLPREIYNIEEVASILGLLENNSVFTAIYCLKQPLKLG